MNAFMRQHAGRFNLAWRLASAVMWSVLMAPTVAFAQAAPTESAVKAAYLLRFITYVEWPPMALPAAPAPLVIGVIGSESVATELPAALVGRKINGQDVVSRTLAPSSSVDGIHVLFLGRSADVGKALDKVGSRPILVVTESVLEPGGMLNFVTIDGRVRFEATPALAESAGLKLGARLLAVSERVIKP